MGLVLFLLYYNCYVLLCLRIVAGLIFLYPNAHTDECVSIWNLRESIVATLVLACQPILMEIVVWLTGEKYNAVYQVLVLFPSIIAFVFSLYKQLLLLAVRVT